MILIKNGTVYGAPSFPEPAQLDILIKDGKITAISGHIPETAGMKVINAAGLTVAPGLVDMHVHFRDPHSGSTPAAEDIFSGAEAAAAGGFTLCCCMPNTSPVADRAEIIEYIIKKARQAPVKVLPYGAVTVGQRGEELTDFDILAKAGAVALSDDGNTIQSAAVMREAMIKAKKHDMLIISHCEDETLAGNHAVNEGHASKALKLPGRPAIAEELMIARDIMLARQTGARLHIAHVSTGGSVDIIRKAKQAGINITAETCPQYFTLTDGEVLKQGSLARVNPPLRSLSDMEEIINGLADGTIDAIVTDHAPHTTEAKSLPLSEAPSGMAGLETSLALTLNLYHNKKLPLEKIIELMSVNPARILGIEAGTLRIGFDADIVIFDPEITWIVDPAHFKSKARNNPFGGMKVCGRIICTVSRGKEVFNNI